MMKNCFVHYMLSCLYTDLLFLFKSKCFSKEKFWIAHSQLKIQTNPVTVLDQLQAARSQKFENLNCKLYMWKNFCHVVFFGCTVNDTSQVLRGRNLPLPSGIPYRKKVSRFDLVLSVRWEHWHRKQICGRRDFLAARFVSTRFR